MTRGQAAAITNKNKIEGALVWVEQRITDVAWAGGEELLVDERWLVADSRVRNGVMRKLKEQGFDVQTYDFDEAFEVSWGDK